MYLKSVENTFCKGLMPDEKEYGPSLLQFDFLKF